MGAVLLSAVITIVAGLKLSLLPELPVSNIVLPLGALSTVIAAWGAFFSPQELWHLSYETRAKLRALEAKLEFAEREPNFHKQEPIFVADTFNEYQAILDEYNRKWHQLRRKSK
jgi:hypothetical protein